MASTWDSYITALQTNVGVDEGAICGKAAGSESVWAASPLFKGITPEQIRAVSTGPDGTDGPAMGSIFTLAGVKAMVIKNEVDDNNLVTTVTMKSPTMEETQHLIMGFTKNAFVIGLGSPKKGCTAVGVEKMTKYLKDIGY